MQPFPPAESLTLLEGDSVAQVWLDPYGVRFVFESQKQAYAQQRVVQVEPDGTRWQFDCVGADGAPVVFHRLLYQRIIEVEREDFKLTLRLQDGSHLEIYSEAGPYESGHLILQDRDFIVF